MSNPIKTLTSHIDGRNATVNIYPDRIEWSRGNAGLSKGKLAAGLMTGGVSMLATGARKNNAATDMLPLASVTGISTRRSGLLYSEVVVVAPANTVAFRVRRAEADELRTFLNDLLTAARTPAPAAAAAASSSDPAAQLRKLAELRDAGILTDAEFDAKKADLLNLM